MSVLHYQFDRLQAGGVELAQNIELTLLPGRVSVLSGPNGVGKSTLLNHLVNQSGQPILLYRPAFGLRDELTVWAQALTLHPSLGGQGTAVQAALERLGLDAWRDEKVASLSSGQKARLGMLSLCLSPSSVWLLDEPVNTLDHDSVQLLAALLRVHLSQGGYVLLVSHLGQGLLERALPTTEFHTYVWSQGCLAPSQPDGSISPSTITNQLNQSAQGPSASRLRAQLPGLLAREWQVFLATSGSLWWSALFLLMIVSFFGLSLGRPEPDVGLSVIWVGSLLAAVLPAKDWFADDFRCGWLRLVQGLNRASAPWYWLSKVLLTWASLALIVLPITAVGGLLLGLAQGLLFPLMVALLVGLLAGVPLLALVSLMVLMTRGGAVLVYILALPMMVPVLIFGLEASQAESLGRSAWPALSVLLTTSGLGLLIGPLVATRLLDLILE